MHKQLLFFFLIGSIASVFLLPFQPTAHAQQSAEVENYFNLTTEQLQQLYKNQINMYTNCLEPYYVPEEGGGRLTGDASADYAKSNWNGQSHVVMLKNKTSSLFIRDAPIQVARTISNNTTCALDKDSKPACTSLYQQQIGSTTTTDDFKLLDVSRSQLITPDGNLGLPHVKSYSAETVNHDFVGVQYFTIQTEGQGGENTDGSSLKLSTFRPAEELVPGAADCLSIHWDPYGKVIDSQSLEPIKGATVTLLYQNRSGNRDIVPMNSGILPKNVQNTFETSADGTFNFPVSPGTYFLEARKSNFTFPISTTLLERVRASLKARDPSNEYLNSDFLYNNPNETIVVKAGAPEERNIVMQSNEPTDAQPEILQYRIVRNGTQQVVTGTVSHPEASVQAYVGNTLLGSTTAAQNGFFRMEIQSSALSADFDPDTVYLQVTKKPIIASPLQSFNSAPLERFIQTIHLSVHAATNSVSPQYPLQLIPLYISGFTYSDSLQIEPNAIVEITIPSLGNAVYAQAHADKNGYVYIGKNFIPLYPYNVRIKSSNTNVVGVYEANEFIALNKTYVKAKNINYYTQPESAVSSPSFFIPSTSLIKEVQAADLKSTPIAVEVSKNSVHRRLSSQKQVSSLSPTSLATDIQGSSEKTGNKMGILAAILFVMVLVPVGIGYVIMKAKNKNTRM